MPGSTSVLVRTMWSYCRYTQRLLAIAGDASSARSASSVGHRGLLGQRELLHFVEIRGVAIGRL